MGPLSLSRQSSKGPKTPVLAAITKYCSEQYPSTEKGIAIQREVSGFSFLRIRRKSLYRLLMRLIYIQYSF